MKKLNKKLIVLVLTVVFLFSPVFAIPAQAQWPVWDPMNFVPNALNSVNTTLETGKELGLDAVGWALANMIIQRIAAKTVDWINTGFDGAPMFVTDPEEFFGNMGDEVIGQFISSNDRLDFLCSPFDAKIRATLLQNYGRRPVDKRDRGQCTLSGVKKEFDDFMGDFEKGGWGGFFELTQRQQNNPIGLYLQTESELFSKISDKQKTAEMKLDWGKGFMSFEVCDSDGKDENGDCIGDTEIATPGSVISEQLNKQLGAGGDKLAVADEINEIVGALLNQLLSKVLSSAGGLLGANEPDPDDKNRKLSERLAKETDLKDYTGKGQDTSGSGTLDEPLCDPMNPLYDSKKCSDCLRNPKLPECSASLYPSLETDFCNPMSRNYSSSRCKTCREDPTLPECAFSGPNPGLPSGINCSDPANAKRPACLPIKITSPSTTTPTTLTIREMGQITLSIQTNKTGVGSFGTFLKYDFSLIENPLEDGAVTLTGGDYSKNYFGIRQAKGTGTDRTTSPFNGKVVKVKGTVTDPETNTSESVIWEITVNGFNRPPELVIEASGGTTPENPIISGPYGTSMSFDAHKSKDPDGANLNFQWVTEPLMGNYCNGCFLPLFRGGDTVNPTLNFPEAITDVRQKVTVWTTDGLWRIEKSVTVYITPETPQILPEEQNQNTW